LVAIAIHQLIDDTILSILPGDLQSSSDDVVCLQEEFDLDVCDFLLSNLRHDPSPGVAGGAGDLSLFEPRH